MKNFLKKLENYDFDLKKIKSAMRLAGEDKEPALRVIMELLPIRPDTETIIAVLLQEPYNKNLLEDEKVSVDFGDQVLHILRGVKALNILNYSRNDRASKLESLRKMFLAMARDLRVILIILTFRYEKMTHFISTLPKNEQELFARETIDLYVPVATRLGMYRIKTKLEDLAFKYSNPDHYNEIKSQLDDIKERCNLSIKNIIEELESFLVDNGIGAQFQGRLKSIYSIYRKLKNKNLSRVNDIVDIFAIRVILPTEYDREGNHRVDKLYNTLGLLHSEWKNLSKKYRDYVAVPKPNGYRSLHAVLIGLASGDMDQPVEVQIRDRMMHKDAEYGVASHWLYKTTGNKNWFENLENQSRWLKGLQKIREDLDLEEDILKEVEVDIFKDRIFVLTPKGEVKDLPQGASPIDFAYSIHTEVGNHCMMAKVDKKAVPLDYELKSGEVVEIVTRKDVKPKIQWLSYAKTNLAKSKIKAFFSSLKKQDYLKRGRDLINEQLEKFGKPVLDQNFSVLKNYLDRNLPVPEREDLIEEVGKGFKMASDVVRKCFYGQILTEKVSAEVYPTRERDRPQNLFAEDLVLIGGEEGLPVKFSACCSPKMGDNIFAYVTRGRRISIHKTDCSLYPYLDSERIIPAGWKGQALKV